MTPSPRTMGEAKEQATQADSRTSWNPPREGRRTHLLDTWMNISARTLGAVPSHRMAYRLPERRGVLAKCLLAFPQDDQSSADVGRVGVGVRLVGVPGYLGTLASHGPTEDLLARSRN